ncbi:hypothetical protein [Pseudomonas kurunegalensis]|uniref:Uncharacterized protein n=1 Tax=Pseudomonas kurunegalensis TaxID=485880 RepID=A0ACC5UKK2_9PSED|nr:hypothetical protein [Pseudomonas kurunegalensis]MBV4514916.1 hypothetical protein [Pseudomonas kurunegalensis]
MDEIYKILIAAAVGFALNPFTEIIKKRIDIQHNHKKLNTKISTTITTLGNAITTLNKTCAQREAFLGSPFLSNEPFMLPYLDIPEMKDDFERAYPALSKNQRSLISLGIHGMSAVKKFEDKISKFEEDLRTKLNDTVYTSETDIKADHDKFYKRILACEKATLYSLITIRENFKLAASNKPQLYTDLENFKSAEQELGISINKSWWPNLLKQ